MDDSSGKFETAVYDSGNTKAFNQISVLPDEIIHHIMSPLDSKDFINTCSLSKDWNRLWSAFPVLQFHQSNSPHDRKLKFEEIGEEQKQRFVNFVYRSMQRFINTRLMNMSIEKFDLTILRMDIELVSNSGRWLQLASQNHVQNLRLCIPMTEPRGVAEKKKFYSLSVETVFASQWLRSVRLRGGFKLEVGHVESSIHGPSLRELVLSNVCLDNNTIRNLFRCCPSITTFSLFNTWGLKKLHLSHIPSVETVEVLSQVGDLEEVYIENAPRLRSIELEFGF